MNKSKIISSSFLLFVVCLLSLTNTFAQNAALQPQPEPSYDVILSVITASNNAGGKTTLSKSLSDALAKMKSNFSFTNYSLDATYFQRTSGSVEVKNIINSASQSQANATPIFSEWSLNGLQDFRNNQENKLVQFQSFRFGQRVPVANSAGAVNYEQIGISLQRFSVPQNMPTVIGSLSGSKPDELTFLVLTVNPTQR